MASIYEIRNIKNNVVYLGSTNDFKRRKKEHLNALNENKHGNEYLQRAWNKYGERSFMFKLIENVDDSVQFEKEQEHINEAIKCKTKLYNICLDVKNPSLHEPIKMTCFYSENNGESWCGNEFMSTHWNQRYCPDCHTKSKNPWEKKKRTEELEIESRNFKIDGVTYIEWDVVTE